MKEFTEQKADTENAIDFWWSDIRGDDEEDIYRTNLIESLQKQADKEDFPQKSNYRIVWLLRHRTKREKNYN